MTTKKELERALELAVSDIFYLCDKHTDTDIFGGDDVNIEAVDVLEQIYAHFLAAAKEQGKKEGDKQ